MSSYTKHTWTTGETITDALLNNIENGIEAASAAELQGSATTIAALSGSEELADVITKVNEIITQLKARGITA